ncbi:MAG: type II toxin-antitoxin system HicB family antitoxin [Clostridiales Family XIII bacterium]|nr:type II toxin-antitoxin system HicB family antitoxin [Clostridiales Family XIII bacterium]
MDKRKLVYPVVLTPAEEGGYSVYMPDFEKNTQGDDLAEALEMAQDALEMMGVFWQDENREIPPPSDIGDIKAEQGDIVTLVPVDFDAYRKRTDSRAVKKTLSLPSWLNAKAEVAGVNFSAVLQEALKERLGVES